MYNKVTPAIVAQLKKIVGDGYVFTDEEKLKQYGRDETEDLLFVPEVVVKPTTTQEVSEILKLANKELITVTPRAAGTGLSGGALPIFGGIILSV
ncbi:MAG: FAD-binding oxidoreductase, partial [Bacteroidia bacterium]